MSDRNSETEVGVAGGSTFSRRGAIAAGVAILGGCAWRRGIPPVVLGGHRVSAEAPLMEALRGSSEHRIFAAALEEAGMAKLLSGNGPFTVFAPTDAAFEAMRPREARAGMAEPGGFARQVLECHVFRTRVSAEEMWSALPRLGGRTRLFALNDTALQIVGKEGDLRWLDGRNRTGSLTVTDAIAANGLIHATDNVILPASEDAEQEAQRALEG